MHGKCFYFIFLLMSVCDASIIPITRGKLIVSGLVDPFQSSHSNDILHNGERLHFNRT